MTIKKVLSKASHKVHSTFSKHSFVSKILNSQLKIISRNVC